MGMEDIDMTNKLTDKQDYAAREYLRDLRELAREYADGDESAYTPRIAFDLSHDASHLERSE